MKINQRGQSLVELLVAASVAGLMVTAASTAIDHGRRNASLTAATAEMRSILHRVRMLAIARDRNVGVKFQQEIDGVWTYAVYEDGDNDGLRNDDIARGVDRRIERTRTFQHPPARIGVPGGRVPDPMSGGPLSARSAVRFSAGLCSFSRSGRATNGSMVLTDGKRATIVQVRGGSAVVAVWRWNGERWRRGE